MAVFLSGYLHLITLAFALTPFVFYGVVALADCATKSRRAQGLRELRDLVVLGVATALPLVAALLPPLMNDWVSLAAKAGTDSVTLHSGYRTLLICFGISDPWLLAIGIVLCAVGVHRAWQRDRELVAYLGFVVLVAIAAIAASHATWLQHPLNFARYIQPMLPFLLLATAEGIVALVSRVPLAGAGAWPGNFAGLSGRPDSRISVQPEPVHGRPVLPVRLRPGLEPISDDTAARTDSRFLPAARKPPATQRHADRNTLVAGN